MSLIDRIAEASRLERKLLMKNERIGVAARKPLNFVKEFTRPEQEVIDEYQNQYPQKYEYKEETEQGEEVTKYRKYLIPQDEPELEQVQEMTQNEYIEERNRLLRRKQQCLDRINEQKRELIKHGMQLDALIRRMNVGDEEAIPFRRQLTGLNSIINVYKRDLAKYEERYRNCDNELLQLQEFYECVNAEASIIRKKNLQKSRNL